MTTDKRIDFLRFAGTRALFDERVQSGIWSNFIVYAYIYADNASLTDEPILKLIYGGNVLGIDFIYDLNDGGGSSIGSSPNKVPANSKITKVSSYAEAEEFVTENNIGMSILVNNINNPSENGAYMVVVDKEGQPKLMSSVCDCGWTYGGDGWHTADDLTNVTVGGIKEGTKLADLVSVTNGDFSRIIEKMLFALKTPIITLSVDKNVSNKKRLLHVNFSVSDFATDYTLYVDDLIILPSFDESKIDIKYTKEDLEQLVKTGGATKQTNNGYISYSFNISNLESNTTYYFYGMAKNESEISDPVSASAKTDPYNKLTYTFGTPKYTNISGTDNLKIELTSSVIENDYTISSCSYTLVGNGKTYDLGEELSDLSKLTDLVYGKEYVLTCNYVAIAADGTNEQYSDSKEITLQKTTSTPSASLKVNNNTYSSGVTTISSDSVNIKVTPSYTVNNGKIKVQYGDQTYEYDVVNGEEKEFTITGIPVNSNENIMVTVTDVYGKEKTYTILVNYHVATPTVSAACPDPSYTSAEIIVNANNADSVKLEVSADKTTILQEFTGVGSHIATGLFANTKYYYKATATNKTGSVDTGWKSLTTDAYVQPKINVSAELKNKPNTNILMLDSETFKVSIIGNDYEEQPGSNLIYMLGSEEKTLADILATEFRYNDSYTISAKQNMLIKSEIYDNHTDRLAEASGSKVLQMTPPKGTISISKVGTGNYVSEVYDLSEGKVTLTYAAKPGIYNAEVKVYLGSVSNSNLKYTKEIQGNSSQSVEVTINDLPVSSNNQTIVAIVEDEYTKSNETIFKFKYEILTTVYISGITKAEAQNVANDVDELFGYLGLTLDDVDNDEEEFDTYYAYPIKHATEPMIDVKTLELSSDGAYKYNTSNGGTMVLFALIPVSMNANNVVFAAYNPNDDAMQYIINTKKSEYMYNLSGVDYDVYYMANYGSYPTNLTSCLKIN